MPPRLPLRFRPSQPLSRRLERPTSVCRTACLPFAPRRRFADQADKTPPPPSDPPAQGPNQDVLPHVSEEAARTGEITGEGGPDLGQGTPVQEILKRDDDGREKAPQVIKEDLKSTKAVRSTDEDGSTSGVARPGHKFGLPELPIPSKDHLKHRYDTMVQQATNLMMLHGKLATAQTVMSHLLSHLRAAPPPTVNPQRPLLPGSPPPAQLPLDPIRYLTLAIDSVAPLFRIRSQKGAAGGGVALQIPVPLGLRQRRRRAFTWILDAASKRAPKGAGKEKLALQVAEEIIAVVEGRSGVWEKRRAVHQVSVSGRANLIQPRRR